MTDRTLVGDMSEQGTHFWFMSMQTKNAAGYYLNSYQGTVTPARGATRMDLFNEVRGFVEENDPRSKGGIVLAFDIQRNKI
ncbi:hypothetical protein GCM10018777_55900 [Streptomyces albogriseolus]|uniref:hypothetical protein n=1 Tax=Streptomyces TaxID=1883 RepID=UPI001676C345|nr:MULTISPECIES: hypothetical protein [Streptomyces]GHB15034.1 hypothetical protein GCM10010330_80720 [Streptomyces tendae]GHG32782.1 hypothetical protein GCM10018777_55900 [Streptomyces viridodiastaticus]